MALPPFKRSRAEAPSLTPGMTTPPPFSPFLPPRAHPPRFPQAQQQQPPRFPPAPAPAPYQSQPQPQPQRFPPASAPYQSQSQPQPQPPMALFQQTRPSRYSNPPALPFAQTSRGIQSQPHKRPSGGWYKTPQRQGSTSATMKVPTNMKKLILGQDHTVINWMRSQSGAEIEMISEDATEVTFRINGKIQCVQKAQQLMNEAILEGKEYINRGHPGNPPKRMPGHAYFCGSSQPP